MTIKNNIKLFNTCAVLLFAVILFSCNSGRSQKVTEEYDTILVTDYDSLLISKEIERYKNPPPLSDEYSDDKMKEAERQLDFDADYNRDPKLRKSLREKGFGNQ